MTLRITIGVDPGQSGAVAYLEDGDLRAVFDMPTVPRRTGGHQVEPSQLASVVRSIRGLHPGAHVVCIVEQVGAMPGQGVSSMFRFGDSYGVIRGVLGALGIPIVHAPPATWKKALQLTGADKDLARTRAIETWPARAEDFRRKKDVGRADAALIALWGWRTGRHAEVA
jgi:hypothetical protein